MSRLRLRILHACEKTIVTTRGHLDIHTSPQFDARLSELVRCPAHLIVNLSHTPYIDSSGLATLLRAHKSLRASGGKLSVVGCQPSVARVLQMVGFHHLFSIEERGPRQGRRRIATPAAY